MRGNDIPALRASSRIVDAFWFARDAQTGEKVSSTYVMTPLNVAVVEATIRDGIGGKVIGWVSHERPGGRWLGIRVPEGETVSETDAPTVAARADVEKDYFDSVHDAADYVYDAIEGVQA